MCESFAAWTVCPLFAMTTWFAIRVEVVCVVVTSRLNLERLTPVKRNLLGFEAADDPPAGLGVREIPDEQPSRRDVDDRPAAETPSAGIRNRTEPHHPTRSTSVPHPGDVSKKMDDPASAAARAALRDPNRRTIPYFRTMNGRPTVVDIVRPFGSS